MIFKILRIAIGTATQESLSKLTPDEWKQVFDEARRQALLGILVPFVSQLPAHQQPPRNIYLQMLASYDAVERQYLQVESFARDLVKLFPRVGLHTCILKGAGLSHLYPTGMRRGTSDVDIWVRTDSGVVRSMSDAIDVVHRLQRFDFAQIGKIVYHHIDWHVPMPEAVHVEVHLRPLYFNNPLINSRFQCWCAEHSDDAFGNIVDGLPTPDDRFNAIYLLAHIYHHLLFEGVGLRHITDYAMLLMHTDVSRHRDELMHTIRRLHMSKIAAALMYIMQHYYGIPDERLLCRPDQKADEHFIYEIGQAGNMGFFDQRLARKKKPSTLYLFYMRTRHRLRFVVSYPGEIIFDWPYRLWNWGWRKRVESRE